VCILDGRIIVFREFIQNDVCLNLAILLRPISTLGVALCLRTESRLLNRRNMVISGGTEQLLHESRRFPLGTGAHDIEGCSDETYLHFFTTSPLVNLPLPCLLCQLFSHPFYPLYCPCLRSHTRSLSCFSIVRGDWSNKGFEEAKYKPEKKIFN